MKPLLYDLFLCHNTDDKPLVIDVEERLRARGIRCWLDRHELRPGVEWKMFVEQEWPRIGALAVFLGPNGVSEGQRYEIDNLIPSKKHNQYIVPVVLDSLPESVDARQVVPKDLAKYIWVDCRNHHVDPVDALAWGINGEDPEIRLSLGRLYRGADGLEDEALLAFLGETTAREHRVLSYPRDVRQVLMQAFEDPQNPDNVLRFHDGVSVPKSAFGPGQARGEGWGLDHIWPKAFGFPKNRRVFSDLHNIAIADMAYNSRRGAGLFYDRRYDSGEREAEIAPTRQHDARGIIARASLYMAARYQGKSKDPALVLDENPHVRGEPHIGSLETLLIWNRLARVTPAERKRNDLVANHQGNRNPFVDRPEFADLVWYPV